MEGKTNEKVENLVKVPLYKKTWVRVLAILLAVVLAVSGVLVNGYISDVRIAESADEMTKKLAEREELQNQWTPVVGEELIRALREQGKADTNYRKAMTAVDEGRYEDAIEPLESLTEQIADVQTKDELLRLLADIYYSYGRFEELVTTCDRLLEIDLDGDGTLHFMKGFAEAQLGEHSSAVENLQEALDRNFGGAQYCELQLLLSATNAGMQDKAISTGEKLLTEELAVEGEIVTCYLTGLNYLQKGEPKKALPLFDRLLKISSLTDDQKAEYTYMRGVANLSAENYKEAKADFDKAIALGLDSTELHYNAAVAALALEDYEAAEKELEIAAGRKDNAELAKSAKEMLEAIKSAQ